MFSIQTVWEDFLKIVHEELGSRVVETWFKSVSLMRWDTKEHIVYLQTPNAFIRDWIEKNYRSIFQVHLARLLNVVDLKVTFINMSQKETPVSTVDHCLPEVYNEVKKIPSPKKFKPAQALPYKKKIEEFEYKSSGRFGNINKKYIFETFVVGPSNSLAYAAARAIAQKPGDLYNPLFIYGDSGLGKTHLLHAIGNEIQEHNKNVLVLYQTADRFVSEFIYAIRFDKIHYFQKKYQEVDVLLIDDIQFISNKDTTQEAFFHIFNFLYDSRKQLVFSSDTFPQNMNGIAQRLRSRLSSGMVTDIHKPCIEVKTAILKKKAEENGEILCDEVAEFLAVQASSSIRELEGLLIRVIACAHLTKQAITLSLVHHVLGVGAEQRKKESIDFKAVIKIVGKYYSYSLEDLRSKNRNKDLALVRQITMYMMKKVTDKSLREIGAFLGKRNHATVKHALSKVEQMKTKNSTLYKQIESMIKECV